MNQTVGTTSALYRSESSLVFPWHKAQRRAGTHDRAHLPLSSSQGRKQLAATNAPIPRARLLPSLSQ